MIGKILADYRFANRMSVRDLAKQLSVSPATICRIESGKPMEQATVIKLINILFGADKIEQKKQHKESK